MNKNAVKLLIAATFLFSGVASAATVILHDGDLVTWDPANPDVYQFSGTLSRADPTFSVGFNMPYGGTFYVPITAPDQFDLFVAVTSLSDFGGQGIVSPPNETVYFGTTYQMIIPGDCCTYYDKWLTISIDGNEDALAYVDSLPGGVIQIGSVLYTPSVPIPPAGWLFGTGLLGLMGVARRKIPA